jgi:hypothetical protein
MKKYIKILALTSITSAVTFLVFQKVLANKNEIKITPAVEVTNKHNDIAKNGLYCPRTISPEEPIGAQSTSDIAEYEHCTSCKMGVFFKDENGTPACSYCSTIKS